MIVRCVLETVFNEESICDLFIPPFSFNHSKFCSRLSDFWLIIADSESNSLNSTVVSVVDVVIAIVVLIVVVVAASLLLLLLLLSYKLLQVVVVVVVVMLQVTV